MIRLLLTALIFCVSGLAQAEYCNWGYVGAKAHRCNGENYYYGTAACKSGLYESVFCHEKFYPDGRACADDNSAQTIECYERIIAKKDVPIKTKEYCNWGFVGPQVFRCNGEDYYYGAAACTSGIYHNIFCHEKFVPSGKDCAEDNSSETIACYYKIMKAQSGEQRSNGLRSQPSGAAQ